MAGEKKKEKKFIWKRIMGKKIKIREKYVRASGMVGREGKGRVGKLKGKDKNRSIREKAVANRKSFISLPHNIYNPLS